MRGLVVGAVAAAVLLPLPTSGACADDLAKVCGSTRGQGSACAQCVRAHASALQNCTAKDVKAFCESGPAPGPRPPAPPPAPTPPPGPPSPPGPPPGPGPTFPVVNSITVEHTGRANLTETVHLDFSASCNITEAYFDFGSDPMDHYYHIPPSAKKAGLMIFFHGGGGDCHQLIDHVHSRITADHVMRLGLGVVFPSALKGNWASNMCKGPGEPDPSVEDLANVNKLVADMTEKGLISADTPIATWGFSSGCSPSLDVRSCSDFRARHKAALAGGSMSQAWYSGPVDTETRTPVYLHIGVHDTTAKFPNGTKINKVERQEQAFRDLAAANVTAERCVPQPYALTQDTLGGVCTWSPANRATMWQWLLTNKWIDSSGAVLDTEHHNPMDVLAAITAAGVPGGGDTLTPEATQLNDILRMGNSGHAFALGCMEHEMAFIQAAMSA